LALGIAASLHSDFQSHQPGIAATKRSEDGMFPDLRLGARVAFKNFTLPKLILLAFLTTLLWGLSSNAQSNTQAGGADTANLTTKIDAIFANYDKPDSPGCAVGVIKDGKLIYARGYGMANLEHNIPNGPQIVYDIGSLSKQFTAASILLLAAQGKLSLDDDVRKYISELPAYQKPITIRQMLHHTSGLREYLGLFILAGHNYTSGSTTEDDAFRIIVRQKGLDFTPGDEFLYSNSGYFLSSIIVKRVSGKPLAEFAKEKIFDPLGMKSTLILDNRKRIVRRRATGYSAARGIFQIGMLTSSDSGQTGDGAVQTSIEDLLRWDQNFYEPKVGGQALVEQMQTAGALNNGQKMDYALALFVDEYKGLRRVWHEGADAGYNANLTRFPDQKFSVACLCNIENANSTQLALRVADLYLADQFKAGAAPAPGAATNTAPITLTEGELKPKIGLYRSPASGELRRITLRDGKLRVDFFGPNSFELTPLSAERFRVSQGGNLVTFERRPDGKFQLLLTRRGRYDQRVDIFEPIAAAAPKEGELVEYTGSYYSEELDTVYHLQVENGGLLFFRKNEQKRPLKPTFPDGFATTDNMQFEFKRDAQGKIVGFTLGMARLRNLSFARQNK
jgi:CubicO group peptidase (beta-lactamase class C family)